MTENTPPIEPADAARARIRPITPADDQAMAHIVRSVLASFDGDRPGSPASDAELAALSAAYPGGAAEFHVVELDGRVLGGGGFGPLAGTEPSAGIAELRKMYFLPELRGLGLGRRLLAGLLERIRAAGYRQVYLETSTRMAVARRLYRSFGFVEIPHAIGTTGHCTCDRRFLLDLPDTGHLSDRVTFD